MTAKVSELDPEAPKRSPVSAERVADAVDAAVLAARAEVGPNPNLPVADFGLRRQLFHKLADGQRRALLVRLLIEEGRRLETDRAASFTQRAHRGAPEAIPEGMPARGIAAAHRPRA